jgi:glyoxylase-like metal-dependent hydrolase (beta-lactamase superfamily II)
MQVGDVRITALSDGSVPQDLHQLLHRTTNGHTDALIARNFQSNPVEASLNAFLLRLQGRLVLVDTGAGQLFGPGNGGKLLDALARVGVQPGQITDVPITHAHDDHSGGLIHDGKRVFLNAVVHVGKPDVDFFFDNGNQARTGYDKSYFDIAQQTLKPYMDAGKLSTFSGRQEVVPGVTGEIHPGHTPGSAFYTLESKGEKIIFVGDIVHVAAVQFPDPSVTIAYDEDESGAARVRAETFASLAKSGDLIAVPHLPFPGFGNVRARPEGGYDWVPVTYTNRAGQ